MLGTWLEGNGHKQGARSSGLESAHPVSESSQVSHLCFNYFYYVSYEIRGFTTEIH